MNTLLKLVVVLSAVVVGTSESQLMQPAQPFDSSQIYADRIVKETKPVLVDFWASWCGPCRLLNPIIKELETGYKGKVTFMKINTEVHQKISAYFQITAIPAIFIIKDKVVVKMIPGLQTKEVYAAALDEVLAKSENATPKGASK